MQYLSITVRNDLFELFCHLAKKHEVSIVRTLDLNNGSFRVQVGYSVNLNLFELGMAIGSYSPTFQLN